MPRRISTSIDPFAPPEFKWMACLGDYDIGAITGTGPTKDEAIADLEQQLDDAESAEEPYSDADDEWMDEVEFMLAHSWGRP